MLQAGEWPSATLGTSQVELELEYEGKKHLLVTLDFAGELFAHAFVHERTDSQDVKDLVNHIDRAAAVILLIDPTVAEGTDRQAAIEDDFGLVQAVQRIRNWPGGEKVPIVLLLTKMDQYKHVVERSGGVKSLVKSQFPALVRLLKQLAIFQVSAVQVAPSLDGKSKPIPHSVPVNVENPIKYCLRAMDATERSAARERAMEEKRTAEAIELRAFQKHEKRQTRLLVVSIALIWVIGLGIGIYLLYWKH